MLNPFAGTLLGGAVGIEAAAVACLAVVVGLAGIVISCFVLFLVLG
jgi:hypothetical protein